MTVSDTSAPEGPINRAIEPNFRIRFHFVGRVEDVYRAAAAEARNRWQTAMRSGLPDVVIEAESLESDCQVSAPEGPLEIDDLSVFVSLSDLDGPDGVIAEAAPCLARRRGGAPAVGRIVVDRADSERLTPSQLEAVFTHELAHVLGFGTLWADLIVAPSLELGAGAATGFAGRNALRAYERAGGTGSVVPVENSGVPASADRHWRDAVLVGELMASEFSEDADASLSAITLGALEDLNLGYVINYDAATAYRLSAANGLSVRGESIGRCGGGLSHP